MNYYNEIKKELINNEIYKKIKDYSKNKSDLNAYYNVGKLLIEAQGGEERAKYGDNLIKEYSKSLSIELNKNFSERSLRLMRQYYIYCINRIWQPVDAKLNWSHYCILMSINDINEINYYIKICEDQSLSKRELINRIKLKEYERLDNKTKNKLITKEEGKIEDFIKNPIVINNSGNYKDISEKILKQFILEDTPSFMKELGSGFSFIDSEYKIKLGDRYNYIDILLFNYIFNSFVVIELKITELKKEYIGQIQLYMNYIDKNVKTISHSNTIGIIICKKDNKFVMEYCSDSRIFNTTYVLN